MRRGYTLIEILMAVVVSAIGFAAIFALQIGNMHGNVSARDQVAAMTLAERAIEQLRAESHLWTETSPPAGRLAVSNRTWHAFSTVPLDHNGLQLGAAGVPGSALGRQRFCVHHWIDRLDTGVFSGTMNVRIRVLWPRDVTDNAGLAEMCTEQGAGLARAPAITLWHQAMLSGTVRLHD